ETVLALKAAIKTGSEHCSLDVIASAARQSPCKRSEHQPQDRLVVHSRTVRRSKTMKPKIIHEHHRKTHKTVPAPPKAGSLNFPFYFFFSRKKVEKKNTNQQILAANETLSKVSNQKRNDCL
ncbi:MAG: hypothetical protein ACJ75B_05065, partial [Flavisolibacter sp.]